MTKDLPPQLTEGVIFDLIEVFRGEGNFSLTAAERGLRVHPGFDISDGPGGDVMSSACFDQIVRHLRSQREPWGFDLDEHNTKAGNRLAWRVAFVLSLAAAYGILGSAETMFSLGAFKKLARVGYHSVKFAFCNFGAPFERYSCWLSNNPSLLQLRAKCTCPLKGSHLRLESSFTQAGAKIFDDLCRPSALEVFGRESVVGVRTGGLFCNAFTFECLHV